MSTRIKRTNADMLVEIESDADQSVGPAVDGGPVRAISDAVDQRAELDRAIEAAVEQARAAGFSWTVIGEALGVSRQAARQRYSS